MADEYHFPMALRSAMQRAATVLMNTADSRVRKLDEDDQKIVRTVLDDLEQALLDANLAVRPPSAAAETPPPVQWEERFKTYGGRGDPQIQCMHAELREWRQRGAAAIPAPRSLAAISQVIRENWGDMPAIDAEIARRALGTPESPPQPSGPGALALACRMETLTAALRPFADAYAPEADRIRKHYTPEEFDMFRDRLDANEITPQGPKMGDYRRAHEALSGPMATHAAAWTLSHLRGAFEAWATAKELWITRHPVKSDEYAQPNTAWAWEVWQACAARMALRISAAPGQQADTPVSDEWRDLVSMLAYMMPVSSADAERFLKYLRGRGEKLLHPAEAAEAGGAVQGQGAPTTSE